jgi:glucose/arabinose dehydrogenase
MIRIRSSAILTGITAGVIACCLSPASQAQPGRGGALEGGPWDIDTEGGSVHIEVLSRDVRSPWSIAFLPDGNLLLSEREGRLRVIRDGALDPTPIEGLPEIDNGSIGGLMGLALHPNFEDNRLLYFAYSKPNPDGSGGLATAVARARWDGGAALTNVEEIFLATPWYSQEMSTSNNRCCGQGPYNGSYGARIAFDEDAKLYITVGDRNWGEQAQDAMSHLGKIVRLNDDGSIPVDNPFVCMDGYLPELYTLGHRNPTGIRFDPATGELYATEFGPRGGDEVNHIVAGGNYGWFLITRGEHYDDAEKALGSGDVAGYIDPIRWWPSGGNPGNLIVYRGEEFPEWRGDILVAAMAGGSLSRGLVRLDLDDDGNITRSEERMFAEVGQRFRDVAEGPDGRIYVLTESSPMAGPGAVLVLTKNQSR